MTDTEEKFGDFTELDKYERESRSDRKMNTRRMSMPRLSSSKLQEIFKFPGNKIKSAFSKRKRNHQEDDSVSLQSVDVNSEEFKEPRNKRQSFAQLLSPAQCSLKAVRSAMKRSASSLSLRSQNTTTVTPSKKQTMTPYRKPAPATPQRRESLYWYQTMSEVDLERFTETERKRQEAIHELYNGEKDLVQDLTMLRDIYFLPMKKLGILKEDEAESIFGNIDKLRTVHEDLLDKINQHRLVDNTVNLVGTFLLDWAPQLERYVSYCENQIQAKALLDLKRKEEAVGDFLKRCQESAFSRKLDLWSFLDVPRSRLVKYPLMINAILKYTAVDHEDAAKLPEVVEMMEDIIHEVNDKQGFARCEFIKGRLRYAAETQKPKSIDESTIILCDGILRNTRNSKVHVFLFDKVFVFTRPALSEGGTYYEVHNSPIVVDDLYLEPNLEGKSSSFRSTFKTANFNGKEKYYFRVSSSDGTVCTLSTNDKHDKQEWINRISEVIDPSRIGTKSTRPNHNEAGRSLTRNVPSRNNSLLSLQGAGMSGVAEFSSVKRHGSSASDREVSYSSYYYPSVSGLGSTSIDLAPDVHHPDDLAPLGSEPGIDLSDDDDLFTDDDDPQEEDEEPFQIRARKINSPLWEEEEEDSKENTFEKLSSSPSLN